MIARYAHIHRRRAQNLSERYRKLENITRPKPKPVSHGPPHTAPLDTVAGFVIPKKPLPPADDECCMSGCAVCVYDVYEQALATYEHSLATLRAALSTRNIPESEWPAHIRTGRGKETDAFVPPMDKTRGAVLDAFEEMERALKEKRDRREAEKMATLPDLREVYEGIKWLNR